MRTKAAATTTGWKKGDGGRTRRRGTTLTTTTTSSQPKSCINSRAPHWQNSKSQLRPVEDWEMGDARWERWKRELGEDQQRGPFGFICDRGAVISCRQIVALYLLRAAATDAALPPLSLSPLDSTRFTWFTWFTWSAACNSEIIKSARYFMNSSWAAAAQMAARLA